MKVAIRPQWGKTLGLCLALLLSLGFTLGLGSCSKLCPSIPIVLDNPTKKVIACNIDGKKYQLAAGGRTILQLTKGEHYMVYKRDTTTFVIEEGDDGSILNPTGSTYVVWTYEFVGSGTIYCSDYMGTEVEGETYYGPYTALTEPYIKRADNTPEGKWYWGLDEEAPTDTSIRLPFMKGDEENEEYWVGKIYRSEDFKRAEQALYPRYKSSAKKRSKRKQGK